MNIKPVFINFIAYDKLILNNDVLENFCKSKIKDDPNVKSTYLDLSDERLQSLLFEINKRLNELHKKFDFKDEYKFVVDRGWCNINNNKFIDRPHCHPTYTFSVVYYVKAEKDCGNLEFITSNVGLQNSIIGRGDVVKEFNAFNSAVQVVPVETGMLLIFPSWMVHSVLQNNSGKDRISIAFDVSLVSV